MKRNVALSNFRTTGFDQNPWRCAMFLQPQTKDLVTEGCPETVVEFPGKVTSDHIRMLISKKGSLHGKNKPDVDMADNQTCKQD